jgi:hypothetical protein
MYKIYITEQKGGFSTSSKLIKSGAKSINRHFDRNYLINGDDITKNKLKWAMMDTFGKFLKSSDAFVVNTDTSQGSGIHWITMFARNRVCYIIDSLGPNNERPNDDMMFETIEKAGLKPKLYPYPFQYLDNSFCGWFAIYVAKLINKNKNSDVVKLVYDVFGNSADDGDIQKLIDGFGLSGKQLDKSYDLDIQVDGEGILDHIKGIYHAIKGYRNNFPPKMREILSKVGDMRITKIEVGRIPINTVVNTVINQISEQKRNDPLYHLFLVCYLSNGEVYRLEKNQSLNLYQYQANLKKDETRITLIHEGLTMNSLLNNAINRYGNEKIFKYRGTSNNCQEFVLNVIDASGIQTTYGQRKWILQDVSQLVPEYAKKVMNFGTDLKNRIDLITEGYGLSSEEYVIELN